MIESSASSPSVLDIDIIEAVQYDDDDDLDDAKNVGSEPDNSDASADDPDETIKFGAKRMLNVISVRSQ